MLNKNSSSGTVSSSLPLKLTSLETTVASHTTQLQSLQALNLDRGGWTTLSTNVIRDNWSWHPNFIEATHSFTDTALDMSLITSGVYSEFRILIDKSSYLTCNITSISSEYFGVSLACMYVAGQQVLYARTQTGRQISSTLCKFVLNDDAVLMLNSPINETEADCLSLNIVTHTDPSTGSLIKQFANSNLSSCYISYHGQSANAISAAVWDVYIVYELQGR